MNANGDLIGFNMYAYCSNNPVVYIDDTGTDAIYVANRNDLWLVGHAYLYIQDEDGEWYRTEFTGKFPFKFTARVVVTGPISYDEIKADISSKEVYDVYLKGNYERSLTKAREYKNNSSTNGYNGHYNLLSNNCLDYATDVLSWGTNIYPTVDEFISNSSIYCVPVSFYIGLQWLVLSEELSSKRSRGGSCGGSVRMQMCRVAVHFIY